MEKDAAELSLAYAIELTKRGDYYKALEAIRRIMDAGWTGPNLALFKARLEFALGGARKAQESAAVALGEEPANGAVFQLLAEIHLAAERPDAASKAIAEAITIAPDDAYNYVTEAKILFKQAIANDSAQMREFAMYRWQKAIRLAPDDAAIRVEFAEFLLLHGLRKAAREQAVEAVRLAPDWFASHAALADVDLADGDRAAARENFRHAEALDAGAPYVSLLRAQIEAPGGRIIHWLVNWSRWVFERRENSGAVFVVPGIAFFFLWRAKPAADWWYVLAILTLLPLLAALMGRALALILFNSRPR